ncbi:involucrin-like isoform X1 [Arapaima gigas]
MSARLPPLVLLLLLAALSACARFAGAQGDPLPPALVDLVTSSSIGSIEDLQRLLLTDSVEGDPDGLSTQQVKTNSTSHRLPRSAEVQVAQQAQCKVRTEVMEVTRSMLDRSNANFVLWPPCVEVQRCSGCCNARTVKCVPTVVSIRHLQVMKIQFVNKQQNYVKVVIPVEDHLECRCQSIPPLSVPRTTARKPHRSQRPPVVPPKVPQLKTQSKQEIHRHDELKQNQKFQLQDRQMQGNQKQVKNPYEPTPATHVKEGLPDKQTPSGGQQMQASTAQRPVDERDPQKKLRPDKHIGFAEKVGSHLQDLDNLQRHDQIQQEVGCGFITKPPLVTERTTLEHEEGRGLASLAPQLDLHPDMHLHNERRHPHKDHHGHNHSHKVTTSQESPSTSPSEHPVAIPQQPRPTQPEVSLQRHPDQQRQQLQEQQPEQRGHSEHQHQQHHMQKQTHTTQKAVTEAPVTKQVLLTPAAAPIPQPPSRHCPLKEGVTWTSLKHAAKNTDARNGGHLEGFQNDRLNR